MPTIIEYYCDPLNPLGWVLEPVRRRVAVAFPDAEWRLHPAGMVEDWEGYRGPEIDGGRATVAATCARLSEEYGMPIDEYLWFDDPPTTSWPACEAISAALLQGTALGSRVLRACREATFVRRRSVSDEATLRDVVSGVPGLDGGELFAAVDDGRAEAAFADHRAAALDADAPGVERADGRVVFPTLIAHRDGQAAGVSGLAGERAYLETVAAVADVEPDGAPPSVGALLERFSPCGWVSAVELAAIRDTSQATAVEAAREVVERGLAEEETVAASAFFRYVDGG